MISLYSKGILLNLYVFSIDGIINKSIPFHAFMRDLPQRTKRLGRHYYARKFYQ